MQITATLGNAQRVKQPSGGFALRGIIYGDVQGRFKDGTFIVGTSKVVAEIEANLFKTESGSIYRVEGWFHPSKATADYETIPADWPVPPTERQ